MGTFSVNKNEFIYRQGERINQVCLIIRGSVDVFSKYNKSTVSAGTMIGLSDVQAGTYLFDYVASTDVTLYSYDFNSLEDLNQILETKPEISGMMVTSVFKQVTSNLEQYLNLKNQCDTIYKSIYSFYDIYTSLCETNNIKPKTLKRMEEITPFVTEHTIDKWLFDYYNNLSAIPGEVKNSFVCTNSSICAGTILNGCIHLSDILDICNEMASYLEVISATILDSSENDIFSLFTSLALKLCKNEKDVSAVNDKINILLAYIKKIYFINSALVLNKYNDYKNKLENIQYYLDKDAHEYTEDEPNSSIETETNDEPITPEMLLEQQLYEQLKDSMETILSYSTLEAEKKDTFRTYLAEYKRLSDKESTDTKVRTLRKHLTASFYELYENCITKSFRDYGISTILKMFFYFGYVDEELAGKHNAVTLYKMAMDIIPDPEERVFTAYDWLKKVYFGEKRPSKNEFDLDYDAYIKSRVRNGEIQEREAKDLLEDTEECFKFEFNNMFMVTNKITFGRISSFCPVFSGHNVLKNLENSYMNYNNISKTLNNIKRIDYSLFYREVSYYSPENKIPKIFIQKEVLPDIILLPNVGSRSTMWQECTGPHRDSPARMMVSIFNNTDIDEIFLRLAGEFRWEICKRVQGARWNDVTDPSLTSEYSDYVQYYKKNSLLTAEAKERIQQQMVKAKKNNREMFVRDYYNWVKYESFGTPRLNKVSRQILYTYCPFSKEFQESIEKHPMYSDLIERHKNKRAKALKSMDFLYTRLRKEGGTITPEIEKYKELYEL